MPPTPRFRSFLHDVSKRYRLFFSILNRFAVTRESLIYRNELKLAEELEVNKKTSKPLRNSSRLSALEPCFPPPSVSLCLRFLVGVSRKSFGRKTGSQWNAEHSLWKSKLSAANREIARLKCPVRSLFNVTEEEDWSFILRTYMIELQRHAA